MKSILKMRGGRSNNNLGNRRYLEICSSREMEYFYLESPTEKAEFSMNLVLKLRSEGIRFLERNKGKYDVWHDVGNLKMMYTHVFTKFFILCKLVT